MILKNHQSGWDVSQQAFAKFSFAEIHKMHDVCTHVHCLQSLF